MQLIDQFNRKVDYIRVSVTDRCDFRCVYCMSEKMTFLPKSTVLSLEEIERLIRVFSELGVKKVRLTGGEPLVRRGIDNLFKSIGKIKALDEITLTTNGSQLQSKAQMLKDAGVERINVSLDSLDPLTFKKMTRTGDINKVLDHANKHNAKLRICEACKVYGSHPHPEGFVAFLDDEVSGTEIEFMQVYTEEELEKHKISGV